MIHYVHGQNSINDTSDAGVSFGGLLELAREYKADVGNTSFAVTRTKN